MGNFGRIDENGRGAVINKVAFAIKDVDSKIIASNNDVQSITQMVFAAMQNGKHFDVYFQGVDGHPLVKASLSRNRLSVVFRDRFGCFLGLIGLRYLAGILNDIARGWRQSAELPLVELRYDVQEADPEKITYEDGE
jgi:hypothetical protein